MGAHYELFGDYELFGMSNAGADLVLSLLRCSIAAHYSGGIAAQ